MAARKSSAKPRPRTGEPRRSNQPLKIDRLPAEVRQAIVYLRNSRFKTWEQIEDLSAKSYSKDWAKDGGGFIDWPALDAELLDEFPGLKLPLTSLHRWYDLRVNQVQRQILAESETARKFAEKFSAAGIDDPNEAVINAMRDEVFSLAAKMDTGSREQYMDALGALTLAMARIQRVDIQRRKVEVDERKVRALEERERMLREKLERESAELERKRSSGELKPEDLARLVESTFGIAPKAA